MRFTFLTSILGAVFLRSTAFVVIDRPPTAQPSRSSSSPAGSARFATASPPNADFAYQEMRIILDAMQRQQISDLASPGKEDLERFVRTVARERASSTVVPLRRADQLVGTSWKLAYSNDLRGLPPDAAVYLQFTSDSQMTYQLKFGQRTLGLNAISANCQWQIQCDSDSTSGSVPQLTFVYDSISMDALGFKNIGTGLFGMLQGRSQTIHTAYFDDDYWIDLGHGLDNENTMSVYVKVEDKDAWRT